MAYTLRTSVHDVFQGMMFLRYATRVPVKCHTTPHMKGMVFAIFFIFSSACLADDCKVSEKLILGDWESTSVSAPFAVMSIEKVEDANSFNSWRHERSDYLNGRWIYANCIVKIINPTNEKLHVNLVVVGASKNRIHMRRTDHASTFTYRRIQQ